jgi:hypothetical protein
MRRRGGDSTSPTANATKNGQASAGLTPPQLICWRFAPMNLRWPTANERGQASPVTANRHRGIAEVDVRSYRPTKVLATWHV